MSDEMTFPWSVEALRRVDPPPTGEPIAWAKEAEPTPREAFEWRARRHFNDRKEFWPHVLDAGELGVLWLWQESGGWQSRWLELERLPEAGQGREG